MKLPRMSIGNGKMIVELCSALNRTIKSLVCHVMLVPDGPESLKVAELKRRGVIRECNGGVLQSLRSLLFSFGSDDLNRTGSPSL